MDWIKISPSTLTLKDMTISHIGSLLKYVNRIVRPKIGDNSNGRYKAIVRPMKPIAIMCIHISYMTNMLGRYIEVIDNIIPTNRNANDNFAIKRVYLYLAFFSPWLSCIILLVSKPTKILWAQAKQIAPAKNDNWNKVLSKMLL